MARWCRGLFVKPREGHPPERIVETPAGMLNAIGLQGIGVHRYIKEKLPELRRIGATNVVNICGSTRDDASSWPGFSPTPRASTASK